MTSFFPRRLARAGILSGTECKMAALLCFLLLVCISLPFGSECLPEPGKKTMEFNKDKMFQIFPKSLYKDAIVSIKGSCKSKSGTPKISIQWRFKTVKCANQYVDLKSSLYPQVWGMERDREVAGFDEVLCSQHITLSDQSSAVEFIATTTAPTATSKTIKENDENPPDVKKTLQKKAHHSKVVHPKKHHSEENDETDKEHVRRKRHPDLAEMLRRIQRNAGEEALVRVKRSPDADDPDDPIVPDDQGKNTVDEDTPKPTTHGNKEIKSPKTEVVKKTQSTKSTKGSTDATKKEAKKVEPPTMQKVKQNPQKKGKNAYRVATTRREGLYLLIVKAEAEDVEFDLKLEVSMESASGFLSAADWPLLPFYGIMSLIYLLFGIIWLIISACQWRDLLRIQFWIGGVIALGMLEKAVFYSEFNNINNTGFSTSSLVVFAELVSALKRTLARMLVIIVSMGFGIVKPRLGSSLHRVLGVGGLYFILATVEASFRSLTHSADLGKQQLIAALPLAVLDAAICWWIFMSLVQTTRTLKIRRNVIKLSLYRHFTNTLVFAVLASVAYMIWSIKTHKMVNCITDWSELWVDEAFWHFLFSLILLVIMVLWRPTANNQRYAFTPLVDFGDDEDEDNMTLSEAFEGMKNRNNLKSTSSEANGDQRKKADDDLKWVEENIPTSAADAVLPSVLDSDEELMTTKFEMSKME